MSHDQLWKDVLRTFFREFMELFFADVAARLDFGTVEHLDQEVFTDLPEGSRRQPDVVVKVQAHDGGAEIVLIHIEVQADRSAAVPARMWEYYSLLRLRRRVPVLPVVVYLAPGAGGLTSERHIERLWGRETLRFVYDAIGLPDLPAEEYLESPSVLAPALSALMGSNSTSRVIRKLRAYERMARADLDEARRWLLLYVVDKYIPLTDGETAELDRLLEPSSESEVKHMMLAYEERGMKKGLATGRIEGRIEGKTEGRTEGEKAILLRLMRRRFGQMGPDVVARVEAITDPELLGVLADRVLDAHTLADMGLPSA